MEDSVESEQRLMFSFPSPAITEGADTVATQDSAAGGAASRGLRHRFTASEIWLLFPAVAQVVPHGRVLVVGSGFPASKLPNKVGMAPCRTCC